MSKSIFENAWRFLKMTDVRVTPDQFAQLGESMNVPEIQQLIDPDPAENIDFYNYLGDRRLGPLQGQHRAGGWMGRGGRKINAPNYLEMNLNQPFSADTLAALRGAGFTAFGRKIPDIGIDDAMHYRIKGGSPINRPPTDEEQMRLTTHPAGGSPNVDLVQAIKEKQKAENIANRELGINPNVEWREGEKERRRLEREAYRQSPEYQEMMAAQQAKQEEKWERMRVAEEQQAIRAAENQKRMAAEAAESRAIREAERQKEEAARAEHEASLIRSREEKQAAKEAQDKLEASPEYQEKKRLEQQADLERERQRSKNNQKGRFIPVRRGKRGGKR